MFNCTERGKVAAVKFTEKSTMKASMIREWWSARSFNGKEYDAPLYNVGVSCGQSGLIVIDEDQPDGFAKYAADHGVDIPETFTVKTAKGRHHYFIDTENGALGNHEGALADYGINVRSNNAYVVGPGSVHASGAIYTIEKDHLPVLIPSWAVDAINAKSNGYNSGETFGDPGMPFEGFELPEVIKEENPGRDNTLFKFASSMRAQALNYSTAKLMMEMAWRRCEQPPVAKTPFTWAEGARKAGSGIPLRGRP